MRRIIKIVLPAAVVVAVAWYVAGLPGHVGVTVGDDLTIDMSVPAAIVAVVILVLAVHLLLRAVGAILGLPRTIRRWRQARTRQAGDYAVSRALVSLAAGDAGGAWREAGKARACLGDTAQTLLLVAEAARLSGRESEATQAFHALTRTEDASFLGYRGLLREAITREDWTSAAELARKAELAHPGAAWLRTERVNLAIRGGRWMDALSLAENDQQRAAFATAAAQAELDQAEKLRTARQAFRLDPSLTQAAIAYATALRAAGRQRRSDAVLVKAWAAHPQPDLAMVALSGVTDPLTRVRTVKRLVAGNPGHPESHLLLARENLAAGLTGEARSHAEQASRLIDQKRVWLLLADIEEKEHGSGAAMQAALRRASEASPDPEWRCLHCGHATPHWVTACPSCHTPGQIRWTTPGEAGVALPPLPSSAVTEPLLALR
ncbi:putative secreted protein [Granulibacter bethesdensis]|uniref:heme biosynthesis HemY N-terminal domain-containing protein n=1 Tax=Granulibacter bethesdensis TaxID=364410 RepID=UPI00090B98A8|nr:heme biosynthesis HemY N-terminal domain-containing protein [Granulibacter bethesdensis]APH58266.1 putative secreted protein [Granulibacter bethesdensis]